MVDNYLEILAHEFSGGKDSFILQQLIGFSLDDHFG